MGKSLYFQSVFVMIKYILAAGNIHWSDFYNIYGEEKELKSHYRKALKLRYQALYILETTSKVYHWH